MRKDELRNYISLGKEINQLRLEIERLRASLHKAQVISDTPRGTDEQDKLATTVAKIVDIETMLDAKINEYLIKRYEIENCISSLPPNLRLLMRLRYIEGMRWEAIACELNYEWAHVHRLHSKALKMIQNDTQKSCTI